MIFLQPLALVLLAAALVPPLLHFFQRRRPPAREFPAVRYLRATEREAQRTLRLQHLLLLLLRIAAVALVALAAARPVVPARLGAGHEPTAAVLVLDNSLSSGAVSGGVRALDDLAARARETLRAAGSADALWLIEADGVARRGTAAALLAAVDAATPQPERLDLSAAVAAAARLVRGAGLASGEIHVLSDLQRTAFGAPDSAAAGASLLLYHPVADPPPNRAVVSVRATPATWLSGRGSVAVAVGGAPSSPAADARVPVAVGFAGRFEARTLAAPGEVTLVDAAAPGPGWVGGEASLEPDELRADDARPFAVRVVPPAAVAAAPASELGDFLSGALAALERAGQARPATGPGAVRVGFGTVPPGAAAVVLPPSDPVGLGPANRALAAAGVPWRFGPRVDREDTLAAPRVRELSGIRVLQRYPLESVPGVEPSAGSVLARAGNDPWLVRAGRVVIVGSRFVPAETALPLSSRFVPFVSALVNRLARGDEGNVDAAPGAAVAVPDAVTALVPARTAVGPSASAALPVPPGGAITAPTAPGVYLMVAAGDTVGALVVAPDPRESDLRRATRSDLAQLFPGARIEEVASPRAYAAARFSGAGRSELTGWLLAAALLVLVAEGLVAAGGVGRSR